MKLANNNLSVKDKVPFKMQMQILLAKSSIVFYSKLAINKYVRSFPRYSKKPSNKQGEERSVSNADSLSLKATGKDDNYKWRLFEKLLLEMKLLSDKHNARFAVFRADEPIGNFQRLAKINRNKKNDDTKSIPVNRDSILKNDPYQAMLAEICVRNNIPLIENKKPYERYYYDAHTNKNGNKAMAEDVVEFIIGNDLIVRH